MSTWSRWRTVSLGRAGSASFSLLPFFRLSLPAALLLAASACDGTDDRTPGARRYAYSATHPAPGGGTASTTLTGAIYLEETSPDTLIGRWDVDRYGREFGLGGWQEDAYVVYAFPTYGGTVVHRIRRVGSPDELACEGHYSVVLRGGSEQRVPLECSIEPTDSIGVPAEIPAPTAPQIRSTGGEPIDGELSDTTGAVP